MESDNLGNLLAKSGRLEEAVRVYRQAVALFEKLVAESPSVPECQSSDLAESHGHLATAAVSEAEPAPLGVELAEKLASRAAVSDARADWQAASAGPCCEKLAEARPSKSRRAICDRIVDARSQNDLPGLRIRPRARSNWPSGSRRRP